MDLFKKPELDDRLWVNEIIKNKTEGLFRGFGTSGGKISEQDPEAKIIHRKMGKSICHKRENFHRKTSFRIYRREKFQEVFILFFGFL